MIQFAYLASCSLHLRSSLLPVLLICSVIPSLLLQWPPRLLSVGTKQMVTDFAQRSQQETDSFLAVKTSSEGQALQRMATSQQEGIFYDNHLLLSFTPTLQLAR